MSIEILIKVTGCFDASTQHYRFARIVFGTKFFKNMTMKLPKFTIPIPFIKNDHGLYFYEGMGWLLK
ncbi:hypothetical protein LCGC14_1985660 [marine sediment metagenome]|uniref:Uncharacterized protein n=1 Tax=marine sediment metagenome TaxID=412755 RepID=A0A0F9F7V8_9ZZZZ